MPSILLENDTVLSEVSGTHLKWTYADLSLPIYELELVYVKKSGGSVMSKLLNPTLTKISLTELEAGFEYLFTIKVVDASRTSSLSNVLTATHPLVIEAPEIDTFGGSNNALNITLKQSSAVLTQNDKVEFVLRRGDNIFMVQKQFSSELSYVLSSDDNNLIANNFIYKLSCRYVPDETSIYRVPSMLSASIDIEPSNKPDAPRNVLLSVSAGVEYGWRLTWKEPMDFPEWSSSGYSVKYTLIDTTNNTQIETGIMTSGEIQNLRKTGVFTSARSFRVNILYANRFGDGVVVQSNSITVFSKPDKPSLSLLSRNDGSLSVDIVPSNSNGRAIYKYNIYLNGVLYMITFNSGTNVIGGLMNGLNYNVAIEAVNEFGASEMSDTVQGMPHGKSVLTASLVNSGENAGKRVNITYNPNGRPITELVVLAYDATLSASEEILRFVELTPQQKNQTTGSIDLSQNFDFDTPIMGSFVVAVNEYQSLPLKI